MKKARFVVIVILVFAAISWFVGILCGKWCPGDWGINFHSGWCVQYMLFPRLRVGVNSDGINIYAFSAWGARLGALAKWIVANGILLLLMETQAKTKKLAKTGSMLFLLANILILVFPSYYFAVWGSSLIFWPIWTTTTGWWNIFPTPETVWKLTTVVILVMATWPLISKVPGGIRKVARVLRDTYN